MQRYATAVLFAGFAAGIFVSGWMPGALWAAGSLAVLAAAIFLTLKNGKGLSGSPAPVVVFVLAVLLIGGWRGATHFDRTDRMLSVMPWYNEVNYVATVSEVPAYGGEKVRFVKLDDLQFGHSGDFPGDFSFSMAIPLADTLRVGDVIAGRAVLLPLRAPLAPGEPDFSAIGHRGGTLGQLLDLGYRPTGDTRFSGQSLRYKVRSFVKRSLVQCGVDEKAAELTLAVVLGDKGAVDPDTRRAYQLSGAMHLLVVSGLHVAIIAGILSGLTFFLSRRLVVRAIVMLALLWGYGGLTGYPPPVLRALWMFSVLALSGLGGGKYFSFGALCFAGLADLALRPQDIYSAGFQMSYAATAAVVLLYGPISRICRGLYPPVGFVVRLVLVGLAAQVALLPFLLYYFDYLNLLFPVSNLLLVPVVSYLFIPLGLLLVVLSALGIALPPLAYLYNALAVFCNGVASEVSQRDFMAVSGLGLSFAKFLLLLLLCAAVVVVWKSRRTAVVFALCGGIVFYAVRLGERSPYPCLVKKGGEYAVETGRGAALALDKNTVVSSAGTPVLFMPGRTEKAPQGDYVLFAGMFFEPATRPSLVLLAPDAPWRHARRWIGYARAKNIPLYDMRIKGYYKLDGE